MVRVKPPSADKGFPRGALWILAVGGLIAAVALVARMLVVNYNADITVWGGTWWDFRDASYFSVRAVLDGVVPYDVEAYFARYPVAQEFPLLPPTYMVLHAPFQLLAYDPASYAMLVVNFAGMVLLSAWSLRLGRYRITPLAVVLVSGLLIASNGGRTVLYTGQSSLVFVAGMYLALTASGVAQGSVGVFISLIKPGFGIPLTILIAAAGRYRRAAIGAVTAAAASAILMVPIVIWAGGIGPLLEIFKDNAAFSAASRYVSLETTNFRVDAAATIAMIFDVVPSEVTAGLIGLAVVVGAASVLFIRRSALAQGNAFDAAIVVVCLGTLLGIYHVFYDLVILLLPTILVTRIDFAGGASRRALRLVLLISLLVASFNPFRVASISMRLPVSARVSDLLAMGITGVSLVVALCVALLIVWQLPNRGTNHIASTKAD